MQQSIAVDVHNVIYKGRIFDLSQQLTFNEYWFVEATEADEFRWVHLSFSYFPSALYSFYINLSDTFSEKKRDIITYPNSGNNLLSDKAITDVEQPNVFDCFEMLKNLALMLWQNGTAKQVNFGDKSTW